MITYALKDLRNNWKNTKNNKPSSDLFSNQEEDPIFTNAEEAEVEEMPGGVKDTPTNNINNSRPNNTMQAPTNPKTTSSQTESAPNVPETRPFTRCQTECLCSLMESNGYIRVDTEDSTGGPETTVQQLPKSTEASKELTCSERRRRVSDKSNPGPFTERCDQRDTIPPKDVHKQDAYKPQAQQKETTAGYQGTQQAPPIGTFQDGGDSSPERNHQKE
ncbi:hypothetical protein H4219_004779 [Mycoemilia scoparia]|uniref:Uncharacterized protein n=1 Tax=Mycoemilia scoparia TaxID=417184 RepID=A0A9W8DQS6_9FUNG|nr:hypothetical protein H4219_004779 [Mycoemilia scoparia]